MALKKDSIIMYEPYELVRKSGRVPKTLRQVDTDGDKQVHFFEPMIDGDDMLTAKIFYEMPTKFARKFLADSRFHLCYPDRMVVQLHNKKKYDTDSKVIVKCGKLPPAGCNSDVLHELEEKRVKIESSEITALNTGKTPEHMKLHTSRLVAENKKEAKIVQKKVEQKLANDPGENALAEGKTTL